MSPNKNGNNRWKLNRPLLIFSVLVIYIFASFIWWSYLLISNNKHTLEQSLTLLQMQYESRGIQTADPLFREAKTNLENRYNTQVTMILGEGAVFLVLLGLAVFQIWRSYRTELQLARQQRNFLLSITHELKSPLASIKLALETMVRRELPQDKRKKVLANSLSDTNRLQGLVEDILLAARFEDHSFRFGRDPILLSELVEEIADRVAHNHPHHRICTDIDQNIYVTGDRQALTSLVANLMENAAKYSPDKTAIQVELAQKKERICLEIADQGYGIPEEEQQNIFKKFYRIGNEDTRKTKGTGLGLFLVKEVADKHGAIIKIKDNSPQGTRFMVAFPLPEPLS